MSALRFCNYVPYFLRDYVISAQLLSDLRCDTQLFSRLLLQP